MARRNCSNSAEPTQRGPRLVYLLTDSLACGFLRGQAGYLRECGFDITVVSSPGEGLQRIANQEGVRAQAVPMQREIAPLADVRSLLQLVRLLRRLRPEIVNAGTMKAALLGMTAAWLAGVPVRIYTLHGLRLETTTGLKRSILHWAEWWTTRLAHRVICVSKSLKEVYTDLVPAAARKATVLGAGSCNGVDPGRFEPVETLRRQAAQLRTQWEIEPDAPVIGFVGRLVRDKGIEELAEAFQRVRRRHPRARLVLLGDFESGDPVAAEVQQQLRDDAAVILPGFVQETAPYYFLMDVFVLPSYREGLPSVPLEAALAEVPVVGFRSTGIVDSVVDGETGMLVPRGDVDALSHAIATYLDNAELRRQHGQAGRRWVLDVFRPQRVWQALLDEYVRCLESRNLPLPKKTGNRQCEVPAAESGWDDADTAAANRDTTDGEGGNAALTEEKPR